MFGRCRCHCPVSYTHLDVYKRQVCQWNHRVIIPQYQMFWYCLLKNAYVNKWYEPAPLSKNYMPNSNTYENLNHSLRSVDKNSKDCCRTNQRISHTKKSFYVNNVWKKTWQTWILAKNDQENIHCEERLLTEGQRQLNLSHVMIVSVF